MAEDFRPKEKCMPIRVKDRKKVIVCGSSKHEEVAFPKGEWKCKEPVRGGTCDTTPPELLKALANRTHEGKQPTLDDLYDEAIASA
ncbi:MAG TPA: hypothetical protein VEA59_00390 [Patescibacteria group bacterium]|nr:hypothetical protein [Patescibacteria group bacterium]